MKLFLNGTGSRDKWVFWKHVKYRYFQFVVQIKRGGFLRMFALKKLQKYSKISIPSWVELSWVAIVHVQLSNHTAECFNTIYAKEIMWTLRLQFSVFLCHEVAEVNSCSSVVVGHGLAPPGLVDRLVLETPPPPAVLTAHLNNR